MKRALRRHQRDRLFKSRKKRLWFYEKLTNNDLYYVINTPTPCSCAMCGNPRKYFRKIKKQEYLSYVNFIEQCSENDIYTTDRLNNIPHFQ